MNGINKRPLLSICIPIYNRLAFLTRQLERLIEDKDVFEEKVELIISDNCSTDDIYTCCEKYKNLGLNLNYHRNETNLGSDGNFEWCFNNAKGQYVWLLGSDDIPVKGLLTSFVEFLEETDFGLIHLSMSVKCKETKTYNDSNEMLLDVSYWITFLSANIIKRESLKSIDLSNYRNSHMIQVPAYLNACLTAKNNIIVYYDYPFEEDTDAANNGGYNFFRVFVDYLFNIYQSFEKKGLLSNKTFCKLKRKEYEEFVLDYIISLLLRKSNRRQHFKLQGSWKILFKHYGMCFYAYRLIFERLYRAIIRRVLKKSITEKTQ